MTFDNQEYVSFFIVLLNRFSSPEQKEVQLALRGGYPQIEFIELYIPENLNIDLIMLEHPPSRKIKRDKLLYILHLIYFLPSRKKKDYELSNGYTNINKSILGKTIKNYREYIGYLKSVGIIEESRQYVVGLESRGLRFTERYRKPIVPVKITDWTLIKNLFYLRNTHYNSDKTKELRFLEKWFDGVEVDFEGAMQYLKEEYDKDVRSGDVLFPDIRLNARIFPIQQLHRKNKLFFADNTAGRLHTYLTQLKSELRKYVKYKGKVLFSIDLCNSQPYLLQSLLDKDLFIQNEMEKRIAGASSLNRNLNVLGIIEKLSHKDDVKKFREIVSNGNFYEEFAAILLENGDLQDVSEDDMRDIVKEITFSTIFSKNNAIRYNDAIRLFKKNFPNVYEIISEIKRNYHPTLAVILQNLEADLFLNKCCKIISENRPDIPLFTLHDSIITTEENIEYVESIILQVLTESIGVKPKLKIERWE